jgi:hypothetical protein
MPSLVLTCSNFLLAGTPPLLTPACPTVSQLYHLVKALLTTLHSSLSAVATLSLCMLMGVKSVRRARTTQSKIVGKIKDTVNSVLAAAQLRNLGLPPALQALATDLTGTEITIAIEASAPATPATTST